MTSLQIEPRPDQNQMLDPLSGESLRRLHRHVVAEQHRIRRIFLKLQESRTVLDNGVNRSSEPRTARVAWLGDDTARLAVTNIVSAGRPQIYLRFELDAVSYFFAAPPISEGPGFLDIRLPEAVYAAERRDLRRSANTHFPGAPTYVHLSESESAGVTARVQDWSYQGICVRLPQEAEGKLQSPLQVTYLDGERAGERYQGTVRHCEADAQQPGWLRMGLSVTQVPAHRNVEIERRKFILDETRGVRAWRTLALTGAAAAAKPRRLATRLLGTRLKPSVTVITYPNQIGQPIRAILNRTHAERAGGTAVIIPPAWGKTKETFLPLALTLIETFELANEPLTVLRFDGTNRRGESYIDPGCRAPGNEYLRFTFSQAVADIQSSYDYLQRVSEIRPSRTVLVTTSLGSIEGRRALAQNEGRDFAGWISLVGMVDLQSGLRTVSGGVDYAYGLSNDVRFGRHELVGVVSDMDHTGLDALEHDLVFAEDARRDMAQIKVPVTWIHGAHDAWMDLTRVHDLLSSGPAERRRLLEVPVGHQMRTSREALEVFQLVAGEVASMALGRQLAPAIPNLQQLEASGKAERGRLASRGVSLRDFWRDYLLGRDGRLGIELMTSTSAYRQLMWLQISELRLNNGQIVADLGSGAGDFPVLLSEHARSPKKLSIVAIDYVSEAGKRLKRRVSTPDQLSVWPVVADLDIASKQSMPLVAESADAVLASLLISYLSEPQRFLRAAHELLRPEGRLVLSCLRRDADISRIYRDGLAELPPDRVRALLGSDAEREFEVLQRAFLNDAAKILEFEEAGLFRFADESELVNELARAGFRVERSQPAFGDPPQATIVTAVKP